MSCIRLLIGLLGLGLLALAGPPHAVASDDDLCDETALDRAAEARSREADAAREFVESLGLSPWQARRLLPLLEKAAVIRLEAYERQAELLPEMVEAYTAFAEQDRLNQGFTPEVLGRTARVHRQAKEAREKATRDLIELEKQAEKMLSPTQREHICRDDGKPGPRDRRGRRSRSQPDDPLDAARRQLNELLRQIYPQPGPIGRYLLHPAAARVVCRIARRPMSDVLRRAETVFYRGTDSHPIEWYDRLTAEVRELRAEINNWNLINGLHLNESQIRQIVRLYEEGLERFKSTPPRRRGRGAPPALAIRASVERAVEQVLNPGQRQVLADYKPCLIPPKNLRDPVRIGQASDHSALERWLERGRRLPPDRWADHIERFLKTEEEHNGPLSASERRKRKALLRQTLRQAARMSDVEFALQSDQLAERIAPPDRKLVLRKQIDEMARRRGLPSRVAAFMLNPRFIDQLRVRGQQMARGPVAQPVDLSRAPQAENCDVTCAVDGPHKKGTKSKVARKSKKVGEP